MQEVIDEMIGLAKQKALIVRLTRLKRLRQIFLPLRVSFSLLPPINIKKYND